MIPSAVFTIPPQDVVKKWLEHLYDGTVIAHPRITIGVFLCFSIWPEIPSMILYMIFYGIPMAIFRAFLNLIGFGREGVRRDSLASSYQSRVYGAYIPEDSLFATSQSYGALEAYHLPDAEDEDQSTLWNWFVFIVRWTSLALALVIIFKKGE